MNTHKEIVKNLCTRLSSYQGDRPISFQKKGVSHSVPKLNDPKAGDNKIYVGELDRVLHIDTEKRICIAEPGITFAQLVDQTLKYGLVPMLVPELKDITIGGAVSGCSVESMSFKYGGFHDSCLEYEFITPEGKILTCNRKKNADIFHMIHGSFGTLGIITKLTFKLIPAKPFVHLIYKKYSSIQEYIAAIQMRYAMRDYDFMDGIIHSENEFVLCLGNFVDEAPEISVYGVNGPYYKSTRELADDYMGTKDYFFRYDSDCHWIARNYGLENRFLRQTAGRLFLGSTKLIRWAKRLGFLFKRVKPDVVIDVFIPISRFEEFFDFYSRENYYPLWIVPYRIADKYPWVNPEHWSDDTLFIDCAIYGMKQGGRDYYKELEVKVRELQGIKTLISYNRDTKEEFWRMFNRKGYERIKRQLDPGGKLKGLYEKTH